MDTPRPSLGDDVRLSKAIAEQIQAAGISPEDEDYAALLEAECDGPERVRRLIRAARYKEAQAKAVGPLMDDLKARKDRLETTAQSIRDVATWAMSEMGLQKLQAPDFSVSIGPGRAKAVITDETALPEPYWRVKREIDRTALNAALQAGPVSGAELSNPEPVMTIRGR